MPRIYRLTRRPLKQRTVNPLLLPATPPTVDEPFEPEAVTAAEPTSTDLPLKELQARAEARGLPTYGTKADLVERLTADE